MKNYLLSLVFVTISNMILGQTLVEVKTEQKETDKSFINYMYVENVSEETVKVEDLRIRYNYVFNDLKNFDVIKHGTFILKPGETKTFEKEYKDTPAFNNFYKSVSIGEGPDYIESIFNLDDYKAELITKGFVKVVESNPLILDHPQAGKFKVYGDRAIYTNTTSSSQAPKIILEYFIPATGSVETQTWDSYKLKPGKTGILSKGYYREKDNTGKDFYVKPLMIIASEKWEKAPQTYYSLVSNDEGYSDSKGRNLTSKIDNTSLEKGVEEFGSYLSFLTRPGLEVKEIIKGETQVNKSQPSAGGKTLEQRLTELKSLLDKGLISQEDYDKKKEELLSDF